jgi:hypothetical protein
MSLEDLPAPDGGGSKKLFETVNVLDPRLCVQDSIQFGVERSGAQITSHIQQASSATAAGCTFDVVVPSLSTLISRKVLIRTTLQFTVNCSVQNAAANWPVLPNSLCLAPFAFQQLCNTMNVTINNQTFTFNAKDQLNEILRCIDKDVLAEFNNYTPVQLDYYGDYNQVSGSVVNSWVPAANAAVNASFADIVDSPFQGVGGLAGDSEIKPRGSFNLQVGGLSQTDGTGGRAAKSFTVTANIVEPLIMSPFLLSVLKSANCGALYGVQNMNFNFSFRSDVCRALRGVITWDPTAAAPNATIPTLTLTSVSQNGTKLEFLFLTPPPSLRLPARNIVPYLNTQSFFVNYTDSTVAPAMAGGNSLGPGSVGGNLAITSNTIQLASIPDKVLLFVKKVNSGDFRDADAYLGIDPSKLSGTVNIQFNNVPGILASATPEQLYEMSRAAGVNMTYNQWMGSSTLISSTADANMGQKLIRTSGALIGLRFGHDIPIPNEYYCPGSIGQFSWQVSLNLCNTTGLPISAGQYQLGMIFIYSGMIVTSLGSTSSYTGLITKQECLDAAEKPVVNQGAYQRVWGGGWWSSLKSGMSKAAKYAVPAAKAAMAAHGSGYSAGGQSAGSKLKSRLY